MSRPPRALLTVGTAVLLWSLGCSSGYTPFEGDEPCTQVAYSVSSVTYRCSGDDTLANQRFRNFQASHTCSDSWKQRLDAIEPSFDCAITINELSCEQAERFGDDLDAWLVDPGCGALFIELSDDLSGDTGGAR